jgi:hypothetical protein
VPNIRFHRRRSVDFLLRFKILDNNLGLETGGIHTIHEFSLFCPIQLLYRILNLSELFRTLFLPFFDTSIHWWIQQHHQLLMTRELVVQRTVAPNPQGYLEVNLEFRIARALSLEAEKVDARTNRIYCPVLDASRTSSAYGMMALPSTNQAGLDAWSKALGLPKVAVRAFAYSSGSASSIVTNEIKKSFDDKKVDTGNIIKLKRGVHTGIMGKGFFDQNVFNDFIWTLHPNLKDTTIDNAFLHSTDAEGLYVGSDMIKVIMTFNTQQSKVLFKGVGPTLSKVEMEELLIGYMGQKVTLNPNLPKETIQAISVRDMHDLYKYGVFPAFAEDELLAAGLINGSAVALTGVSSL